jgi:chromosome segregation ATPase
VEDRISELKDKIETFLKTEEMLVKQLKDCERNMQELADPIKRPDLRLMDIEEGEEVQAKGIHKIFKKTTTKSSQISRKFCTFRYRKPPGHQADLTKIKPPHGILSLKQHAQRMEKEY